jgi:hypothetical protein
MPLNYKIQWHSVRFSVYVDLTDRYSNPLKQLDTVSQQVLTSMLA